MVRKCSGCENRKRIKGDPDDPLVIQQWLDQDDAWFRETVRRYGWAIQHVSDDAECGTRGDDPPFAYTVGLWGYGHPEVVVFGLRIRSSGALLNQLGDRVSAGETFNAGVELAMQGPPVRLFEIPNPGQIIFAANRFYGRPSVESVPALQAVYPDVHGTWPWEPDCHLWPPGQQPLPGTFRC